MWTKAPKGTAKERGKQRKVRRTFKMLKEMQLNIRIEKTDIHEGITVKVLLDSSTTEMFMDWKMVVRHGFRLQKLERPVVVRNVDRTNNRASAIIHQVEVNVYYKNHIERMKIDIYNLERTKVILGVLQLQVYNLKINWEIGKIKIMRYLLLYGKNTKKKENRKAEKRRRIATVEKKKIIKQVVNNKKDWKREKEVEVDYRKIKEIVSRRFLKWKKIFGKIESERIPTRKIWNYTIDLKKIFKL